MKKLMKLGFFLIATICLVSCDKEPVTDIGVIQTELKTVIKDNSITKCSVIVYDSNLSQKVVYSNSDFSISNGSLIITAQHVSGGQYEQRYNLLYLSNYTYAGNYIYFYFSGIYN